MEVLYRNIYGVDIADYSIERTKILLCLYALTQGEDVECFGYNLHVANSLEFDWNTNARFVAERGFDVVIGNPPYVSSIKISNESKALLINWDVCTTGKPDLYIPFFQIGIELLNDRGVLSYITVSNFYRSLNGRAFRRYMSEHMYDFNIVDFGAEQVFKGRSTYTCICTISHNVGPIYYVKTNSSNIGSLTADNFTAINYCDLSDNNGWLLQANDIANNITVIESTGIPLSQYCNIKNGFATLKNDVYILDVKESDETYYYINADDKIEKSICRDAVKPNTLKHEDELEAKIEHLLFPYHVSDGTLNIIPENELAQNFPCAYKYLLSKKEILSTRDKGQREYPTWYSFGRSQALTIKGYKLLFPYIADKPYFVISEDQDLLFYNGYALVSDVPIRIEIARKILRSKIFWYYIKHTSKPYGSNYFALAKNYIKNFGIPYFTNADTATLLALTDEQEINDFLLKKYEINHI